MFVESEWDVKYPRASMIHRALLLCITKNRLCAMDIKDERDSMPTHEKSQDKYI